MFVSSGLSTVRVAWASAECKGEYEKGGGQSEGGVRLSAGLCSSPVAVAVPQPEAGRVRVHWRGGSVACTPRSGFHSVAALLCLH